MRKKPSRRLTDIGGMAFAEFQLARRGVEFARTLPGSPSGDLWAEFPIGRIAVEIKTTFSNASWHVKRGQSGADLYFLVRLETCDIHILTAPAMRKVIDQSSDIFPGVALVKRTDLPRETLEAWGSLGLHKMPGIFREPRQYKSTRVVRRMLATGEIKTYTYAPSSRQIIEKITNASLDA